MKSLLLMGLLLLSTSCTQREGAVSTEPSTMTSEQLKSRGKSIYVTSCLSCHGADPSKDGALGPAIQGSSLELLTARILHATYPPGYKPKKQTAQMPKLPHLEKEIPALHEYLSGLK